MARRPARRDLEYPEIAKNCHEVICGVKHGRKWKAMKKTIIVMAFILLLPVRGFAAQTSEHASHPHVHKKHAQLKNPIPLSEKSIEAGKTIFEKHCVACHATGGIGPDLMDEQWIHGPSDGEIFHVISDGVAGTPMKGFKQGLSDEMRWHLVHYLRNSGKKVNR